jgi:hypothetical protein
MCRWTGLIRHNGTRRSKEPNRLMPQPARRSVRCCERRNRSSCTCIKARASRRRSKRQTSTSSPTRPLCRCSGGALSWRAKQSCPGPMPQNWRRRSHLIAACCRDYAGDGGCFWRRRITGGPVPSTIRCTALYRQDGRQLISGRRCAVSTVFGRSPSPSPSSSAGRCHHRPRWSGWRRLSSLAMCRRSLTGVLCRQAHA